MDKISAFKLVLDELKKCSLFCGEFDAKHGNKSLSFMFGIECVMEYIASEAGDDKFIETFDVNMIKSEYKQIEGNQKNEFKKKL